MSHFRVMPEPDSVTDGFPLLLCVLQCVFLYDVYMHKTFILFFLSFFFDCIQLSSGSRCAVCGVHLSVCLKAQRLHIKEK